MRILVDGDSCPVKEDIVELAVPRGCPVLFVAGPSTSPRHYDGNCVWIGVGPEPQEADHRLLLELRALDVVVCADGVLAARAIQSGGLVLTQRGNLLTYADLAPNLYLPGEGLRVLRRHALGRNHDPYRDEDRHRFRRALKNLLEPSSEKGFWVSFGGKAPTALRWRRNNSADPQRA